MRAKMTSVAFLFAFTVSACEGDTTSDPPAQRITMRPIATLSGVGDSIDLAMGMPAMTASGLIVAPLDLPPSGAVGVFDSTGRFLQRIGRSGGGPGEFQAVRNLGIGPGDSLWVIDNSFLGHVFGPPPFGEFVRTVRFERPNTGRITRFGILSAGIYTSDGAMPAHLVDWEGALLREYGASALTTDIHDRLGAPGLRDSAHVWVPHANAYILELLGADGEVHQRLERHVPWFPSDSEARRYLRPRPRIHAVNVGNDGLLWVLIRRAHREWKPETSASATRAVESVALRALGAHNLAEVFEGVLEVLDPRDGRLVASLEVSGGVLGFPSRDLLYEVVQDDLGRVRIHIWRLDLAKHIE